MPAYRRLLLNKARDVSRTTFQRLKDLDRRFPFQQTVLAAFQKAGVELRKDTEGPSQG
jgi:hypothetical protein